MLNMMDYRHRAFRLLDAMICFHEMKEAGEVDSSAVMEV